MEQFRINRFPVKISTVKSTAQHVSRQTEAAIISAVNRVIPSIGTVGGIGLTIGTVSPGAGIITTTISLLAISSTFLATVGAVESITGEKLLIK